MFKGIPPTPIGDGVPFGLQQFMEALRVNTQALTDNAVIKSSITLATPKTPALTSLSYDGLGLRIPDVGDVPTLEDVQRLAQDVARLASDVAYILQYLSALSQQLRQT